MPWHIGSSDSCPAGEPFAVIKDGTSTIEGCHATKIAATKQLAALYASEPQLGALKATLLDDDAFRLLAIPFGGPIPSPKSSRGTDLDGEWFSERTDIRPDWIKSRVVDWHHGGDDLFGRQAIGKAVDPMMDEDGWWVTVWLDHGQRRINLIKKLAERGAQLFGSSESVSGLVKKDKASGEILVWPYLRQTLSTSPQNTFSVLRSAKAALDDLDFSTTTPSFWADMIPALTSVADDLRATLGYGPGESVAHEARLKAAVDLLDRATQRALEVARQ
jgi:hypothetical protein